MPHVVFKFNLLWQIHHLKNIWCNFPSLYVEFMIVAIQIKFLKNNLVLNSKSRMHINLDLNKKYTLESNPKHN